MQKTKPRFNGNPVIEDIKSKIVQHLELASGTGYSQNYIKFLLGDSEHLVVRALNELKVMDIVFINKGLYYIKDVNQMSFPENLMKGADEGKDKKKHPKKVLKKQDPCPNCGGSGTDQNTDERCSVCQGSGWVPHEDKPGTAW